MMIEIRTLAAISLRDICPVQQARQNGAIYYVRTGRGREVSFINE